MKVTIVMNCTLVNSILLTKFIERLNPNKTKALVISRSRTVSPPQGDLVLFEVSIRTSPNLDILGLKFDSKLAFEDHVRSILFRVSKRIDILRLVKRYLWTPLCYFVAILHLFSQSLSIVLWCGSQLLNVTFSFLRARCIQWPGFERHSYSVARLCPDKFLVVVSSTSCVGLSMLCKVNSNSYHCLFNEHPSASNRVRHTRAAAAAHPFGFVVLTCRTSQFARSFLPAQV